MKKLLHLIAGALALVTALPAIAATPREMLATAAFDTTDKSAALATVNQALAAADALLAANPRDREGQIAHAIGIGYRAKLTRSLADAKASRQLFEQFVAANPRDAEGQLALGGWHLDAVAEGFMATTMLGAKKDLGLAAIDRAVALGGDRAFYKGFAALMRARLNPADPLARTLAEQAAAAPAPTPLDRIAKRDAATILPALRAGDGSAGKVARSLMPFGRL